MMFNDPALMMLNDLLMVVKNSAPLDLSESDESLHYFYYPPKIPVNSPILSQPEEEDRKYGTTWHGNRKYPTTWHGNRKNGPTWEKLLPHDMIAR
jgi:hypothetical protein